jgi:hypothetical protein
MNLTKVRTSSAARTLPLSNDQFLAMKDDTTETLTYPVCYCVACYPELLVCWSEVEWLDCLLQLSFVYIQGRKKFGGEKLKNQEGGACSDQAN